MTQTNIETAKSYYESFNRKDLSRLQSYLHPDVHYVAPMGTLSGRSAVAEAASRLFTILKQITIRAEFDSANDIVLIYDLYYGDKGEICRTASMMHFTDGLISRIELFYDARPFGNL